MEWLERHRGNLAAALLVLVAVAAFAVLQVPRRPALQVVSTVPSTPVPMKVHVVGAVNSPGVYSLPSDARVEDAIEAAGGASETADLAVLNLATPLKDGQQVVIPSMGAGMPAAVPTGDAVAPNSAAIPRPTVSSARATASSSSGKTNLNTATRQELEALPGIGTAYASRILEWRATHGGFTSVEELKDSKILNASTFEKVRSLVEVK